MFDGHLYSCCRYHVSAACVEFRETLNAEVQVIPNGMATTFVYISTKLSYLTFIGRFNENCAKCYRNSVNFSMKSWTVDQVTVSARVESITCNA